MKRTSAHETPGSAARNDAPDRGPHARGAPGVLARHTHPATDQRMATQDVPTTPVTMPPAGLTSVVDLRGTRILVVDDDRDTCETLASLLRIAKAEVSVAYSAFEALRELKERRPDLILSDLGMPDGDGYQLMKMVRSRSQSEGGWTPAIALTGQVDSLAQTRALLSGFQCHLAKPVGALELLVTIRSTLTARKPA